MKPPFSRAVRWRCTCLAPTPIRVARSSLVGKGASPASHQMSDKCSKIVNCSVVSFSLPCAQNKIDGTVQKPKLIRFFVHLSSGLRRGLLLKPEVCGTVFCFLDGVACFAISTSIDPTVSRPFCGHKRWQRGGNASPREAPAPRRGRRRGPTKHLPIAIITHGTLPNSTIGVGA